MNDDPLMRVMRNIKTSPGPGVGEAIDKRLPPYTTLSPAPEANKRLIDDLVAALGAAVAFIVREYHDPALEPEGEWLPPHARKIHAQLAAALSKAKAKPGEQK